MQKLIFLVILCVILAGHIYAQKATVSGLVVDTIHQQKMAGATISLVNTRDSSLVGFVQSDSAGKFGFTNLAKGRYRLSVSYTGFYPTWKSFTLGDEEVLKLEPIHIRDKSILSEVIIESEKPPVTVNGDTLEFNAGSFVTKPNAVVEDLLKKMPGIQVDKDGTIRVNGQVIKKVFVNGKEFFTGDPTLATRNLSADAVDKVQVFEKKSDKSEFTGFNDGNSQTAINLKLKKDKKNPTFGKATAGAGSDDRYQGQFHADVCPVAVQSAFVALLRVEANRSSYRAPNQTTALDQLLVSEIDETYLGRFMRFARSKLDALV